MAGRNYDRLSIEVFGRQLITSGDLDPVYIVLHKLDWAPAQVNRWLIAYWCFYHCGFASYASEFEGNRFWDIMAEAAVNETTPPPGEGRWPRGSERRHARGAQGMKMVKYLGQRYGENTDGMVAYIIGHEPRPTRHIPFSDIAKRVEEHTLFGPWIAFKIADMVDRVLGVPVNFEQAHVFMFKDPVKAALMLWQRKITSGGVTLTVKPRDQNAVIGEVVGYLIEEFCDLPAPPMNDRPIGLQEVETVLCKWKSHMNGHYPLNNDIDEINEGLEGWGQAAADFAAMMPEGSQ